MQPLIVSAPFGNYYRFLGRVIGHDFTPTLGTFTWERRGYWTKPYGGLLTRMLLTLRYSPTFQSWKNRIGLKNPGLRSLVQHQTICSHTGTHLGFTAREGLGLGDKILSIYGWNMEEWNNLLGVCKDLKPLAVEINASCPNVHKPPFSGELFVKAVRTGLPVVVKLPPVGFQKIAAMAWGEGVRTFHATNTLPTPKGGLSGKALLPVALEAVRQLRDAYPDAKIIGGGGITTLEDAQEFRARGANHVAVGSVLFSPWRWRAVKKIALTMAAYRDLEGILG